MVLCSSEKSNVKSVFLSNYLSTGMCRAVRIMKYWLLIDESTASVSCRFSLQIVCFQPFLSDWANCAQNYTDIFNKVELGLQGLLIWGKIKLQLSCLRHKCTIWHFLNESGVCSLWSFLIQVNIRKSIWLTEATCSLQKITSGCERLCSLATMHHKTTHPLKTYLCLQRATVQEDWDIPRTGWLSTNRPRRSQWRSAWPCIRQQWPRRRPTVLLWWDDDST